MEKILINLKVLNHKISSSMGLANSILTTKDTHTCTYTRVHTCTHAANHTHNDETMGTQTHTMHTHMHKRSQSTQKSIQINMLWFFLFVYIVTVSSIHMQLLHLYLHGESTIIFLIVYILFSKVFGSPRNHPDTSYGVLYWMCLVHKNIDIKHFCSVC